MDPSKPSISQAAAAIADLVGAPDLELQFENGERSLSVRQFSISERMSAPFEAHVEARAPRPDIDLGALLGKGGGLILHGLTMRVWTGIVKSIELSHAEPAVVGLSTYNLVIVPDVWLLSQRSGHRIFQHLSAVEIIEKLMAAWQLPHELKVERASHPKLEYRVQHGEDDLSFLSRICEEASISYHFVVREQGGKKKSVLVFDDAPHDRPPRAGAPLVHVENPNEAAQRLFVTNVRLAHRVRPGVVSLRDYDFRRPGHGLLGQSEPAPMPEANFEQYHYLPGASLIEQDSVSDPQPVADDKSKARHVDEQLKRRAQRWLDALRRDKRLVDLESNCYELAPGVAFDFGHHPRADVNEQKLMCIETGISGTAGGEWALTASAVFSSDRWRPPLATPKPRVLGPESAIVVGPKSDEIYSDENGRVRVRFHWDREGAFDDTATCWLRVSQMWAGAGYGSVLVPRVGHEVLVDFLDGDPDQPVVVGRLYNGVSRAPYQLPKHKTRSTWKSNSSPHADKSFNEIMFEDAAGHEVVFVQAQRDARKLVKRHESERTGNNRVAVVGKKRVSVIGKNDSFEVGGRRLVKIATPKNLKILEMGDAEITPKKTWVELVDRKITLTTGKASIVLDGPNIEVTADGDVLLHADRDLTIKGAKVFLNALPAKVSVPNADHLVKDRVMRPGGRVMASILKLFYQKPDDKKFPHEAFGVVPLAAEIIEATAALGGVHFDERAGALVPNDPDKVAAAVDAKRKEIAARIGAFGGDTDDALGWKNGARSVEELHADAVATEPSLRALIGNAAAAGGGTPSFGPGDAFAVKSFKSLKEKVEKRGKPLGAISDAVRGSIVTDSPEALRKTADALKAEVEKAGGKILFDNKFASPNAAGYGAVHGDMFLPSPSGRMIRSEVQLHVRSINDGTSNSPKEVAHVLQEKTRVPGAAPEQKQKMNQASQAIFLTGLQKI
jgi:type VI secretion system secreted protein VgrG